jgi:hypothetical protein
MGMQQGDKKSRPMRKVNSFKSIKSWAPKRVIAKLVDSTPAEEPNLNRAYLSEILSKTDKYDDYVQYWEDTLCWSMDAKTLFEPYDPRDDSVGMPPDTGIVDNVSIASSTRYDSTAYANYEEYPPDHSSESSGHVAYHMSYKHPRVAERSSRSFQSKDYYPRSGDNKTFSSMSYRGGTVRRDTDYLTDSTTASERPEQQAFPNVRGTVVPKWQKPLGGWDDPRAERMQQEWLRRRAENAERNARNPFYQAELKRVAARPRAERTVVEDYWLTNKDRLIKSITLPRARLSRSPSPTFSVTSSQAADYFADPPVSNEPDSAILASQVDEPPFLAARDPSVYRPTPGTRAIPAALRHEPLLFVPRTATNDQTGSPTPIENVTSAPFDSSPSEAPIPFFSLQSSVAPKTQVMKSGPPAVPTPVPQSGPRTRAAAKREQESTTPRASSRVSSVPNAEEGDTTTALMVRSGRMVDKDLFIVDTGCLGSHVFKSSDLLTRVTSDPLHTHEVRDFSGNRHQTAGRGYLFNTRQHVLVMPDSKVNLLSTEQMFKDGAVSCAIATGDALIFMNKKFQTVLKAVNKGNGAYVCTADDLRKAFSIYHQRPTLVHIAQPTVTIYHPCPAIAALSLEWGHKKHTQWIMPALSDPDDLSQQQRQRAVEARELHVTVGHPGDTALIRALDNGNLIPTRITSQDVQNANILLGPCLPCLQSKMKAPTERPSHSPPAENIGDHVHADIVPVPTSVGGNNFILFAVDERSDYIIGIPMTTKSTSHLVKAVDVMLGIYLQKGHTLSHLTTDNEINLRSMETHLRQRKISLSTTPAGLHEKKAERTIQTVKRRLAATKAGLSYVLPSILEAEAYVTLIRLSNIIPTVNTNARTPYELFHREKPKVPAYAFGTIALCYHPRSEDKTIRAEIGIFLSHGYNLRYLKVWIPHRHQMYSMRALKPLKHQVTPPSWNYPQNKHGTSPVPGGHSMDIQLSALPKPPSLSSLPVDSPIDNNQHILRSPGLSTSASGAIAPQLSKPRPSFPASNREGASHGVPSINQEGEIISRTPLAQLSNLPSAPQQQPVIEPRLHVSRNDDNADTTMPQPYWDTPLTNHGPTEGYEDSSSIPNSDTVPFMKTVNDTHNSQSVDNHTQVVTRSGRTIVPVTKYGYHAEHTEALATNLKKLLQLEDRKEAITQAINEEIDNLMGPGVMEAAPINTIRPEHRRDIINLWLFHKEKRDSNGVFLKDKCRIVTLSQVRDTSKIGDTYSPTVNPISLFILLAKVATMAHYSISAYDVKGAFLNSPVPDDKHVYVRVDAELSNLFIERYPSLRRSVNDNGTLTFRLRRYLYGLQESPLAWNKLLHDKLGDMGFTRSTADPCAYVQRHPEGNLFLTVHVDDMLLMCPNSKLRTAFESEMEKRFEITKQLNDLSYLGMTITKTDQGIRVHQAGYIDQMGAKFKADLNSKVSSPTGPDFLSFDPDDEHVNVTKYLGIIMSLMFLARFTRMDILMPVTFLATKSADPRQKDFHKAVRILNYVLHTKTRHLWFDARSDLELKVYTDASHMLHLDAKGHGGIVVTFGGTVVASKSFKMKLVTKSSTESELVAVEESVPYVLWMLTLLQNLNLRVVKPVSVMQDNLSAIGIINNGGSFSRSKHMIARHGFVKQHVDMGDITFKHCPGDVMPADILTKPMEGSRLKKLSAIVSLVDDD